MIHIFMREAAMTKYYHVPNYARFKHLVKNLYHYAGLDKTISDTIESFYERTLKSCLM